MKYSVIVAEPTFAGVTTPLVGTYADVCRQAQELGFDAVQLTINRPKESPIKEIQREITGHHLAVSGIATGLGYARDGLSLGSSREEIRREAVRRMREHMEKADELGGADVIIGTIRGRCDESGGKENYMRAFDRSIEELLPEAGRRGVTLLLEANDRRETDIFLSLAETVSYLERWRDPFLRLQIDSLHMYYEESDFEEEIRLFGPWIAQADISDVDRMAPDGKHFDFPAMLRALRDIGYQRYLAFEYRENPPENAAGKGLSYIRSILEIE